MDAYYRSINEAIAHAKRERETLESHIKALQALLPAALVPENKYIVRIMDYPQDNMIGAIQNILYEFSVVGAPSPTLGVTKEALDFVRECNPGTGYPITIPVTEKQGIAICASLANNSITASLVSESWLGPDRVLSSTGSRTYLVTRGTIPFCTCSGFQFSKTCKHVNGY